MSHFYLYPQNVLWRELSVLAGPRGVPRAPRPFGDIEVTRWYGEIQRVGLAAAPTRRGGTGVDLGGGFLLC